MDRKELDRPEYGSYEDVHEQLVQAMQEACMNDTSREYKTPDIDMSFLYDDTVPEMKKTHRFTRFNKVAAIVIATLLGLNAVLLISDSNDVYSEKGLLHRICEGARGIFTDEDPSQYVEMDETGKVQIITNYNKIYESRKIWIDILIPEYIPDGYSFIELRLTKNVSNEHNAIYKYNDGTNELKIWIYDFEANGESISIDKGEIINKEDRIINVYFDSIHKEMIADVYIDDKFVCISGKIIKEEIIKIANKLN